MYKLDRVSPVEVHPPTDVDQLELKLQAQLSGRVRRLHLVRMNAGLVLRGSARTYHAKQLAQHAVMQLTAMPIVANEIDVS